MGKQKIGSWHMAHHPWHFLGVTGVKGVLYGIGGTKLQTSYSMYIVSAFKEIHETTFT